MTVQDSFGTTDGRVARGRRTRQAVVDAHTALLREGVLKPTGQMLADRAGVSLRAVWLNFGDLEGLLEATTDYWRDADQALRRPIDPALSLPERIDAYCAQRAERLEHIAPGARSAALGEPFSAALQKSRRDHVARADEDIAMAFGPELEAAGVERETLRIAIFVAGGWPEWSSLRDDHGLDPAQAEAIMRFAVTRLLQA